jgi:hypothetical protein
MFNSAVLEVSKVCGPWIVVGKVERLHADLQQHFAAFAARARDPTFEVGAVGRERHGDLGRQLRQRLGGAVRSDAEPLDHDRDARRVGARRLRLGGLA